MNQPQAIPPRKFVRRRVINNHSRWQLMTAGRTHTVTYKAVDVSLHGVGLMTKEMNLFQMDAQFVMLTDKLEIPLKVRWVDPKPGENGEIKIGLLCLDDTINMERYFPDYELVMPSADSKFDFSLADI